MKHLYRDFAVVAGIWVQMLHPYRHQVTDMSKFPGGGRDLDANAPSLPLPGNPFD